METQKKQFWQLKNPKEYENVKNQIKNTIEAETKNEIEVEVNSDLLRFEGVLSESTLGVLYGIASVIIVIIIVSSVFVIRNSFSISVSEKTKQYGMLASVGANKKKCFTRRIIYWYNCNSTWNLIRNCCNNNFIMDSKFINWRHDGRYRICV